MQLLVVITIIFVVLVIFGIYDISNIIKAKKIRNENLKKIGVKYHDSFTYEFGFKSFHGYENSKIAVLIFEEKLRIKFQKVDKYIDIPSKDIIDISLKREDEFITSYGDNKITETKEEFQLNRTLAYIIIKIKYNSKIIDIVLSEYDSYYKGCLIFIKNIKQIQNMKRYEEKDNNELEIKKKIVGL